MKKLILLVFFIYAKFGFSQAIENVDPNSLKNLKDSIKSEIILYKKNIVDSMDVQINTIKEFRTKLNTDTLFKQRLDSLNLVKSNLDKEIETVQNSNEKSLKEELNDLKNFYFYSDIEDTFWDSTLNSKNILITAATKDLTGSIFAELVSDRIGLFKFTLASVLTASSNDSANKDIQTFFSGGGNAILKIDVPIFYLANINKNYIGKKDYNSRSLGLFFMPRISTILPALGSTSEDVESSFDLGIELQGKILTINKYIGISGRIRGSFSVASNGFSFDQLGINKSSFWYSQASLTLNFKSFGIYINIPFGISGVSKSDLSEKSPATISVSTIF